MSFKV